MIPESIRIYRTGKSGCRYAKNGTDYYPFSGITNYCTGSDSPANGIMFLIARFVPV